MAASEDPSALLSQSPNVETESYADYDLNSEVSGTEDDLNSEVSGTDDDIGCPTGIVAEPELPSKYFTGAFQRMVAELGVAEQQRIRYIQDRATRTMQEKADEAAAKATGQASKQKQCVAILVDALKKARSQEGKQKQRAAILVDADAVGTTYLPFLPGAAAHRAHGVSEVASSGGTAERPSGFLPTDDSDNRVAEPELPSGFLPSDDSEYIEGKGGKGGNGGKGRPRQKVALGDGGKGGKVATEGKGGKGGKVATVANANGVPRWQAPGKGGPRDPGKLQRQRQRLANEQTWGYQ
jgi:hypothetical protein